MASSTNPGDDTPHPIEHVRVIPLSHFGHRGKLMHVLYITTITKHLILVRQIVDQGMQARFTHLGCVIEEEGQIIVQQRRDGRMFILDTNDIVTAVFGKGQKVESDIDLLHKRIGHVNYQRP